MESLPTSAPGHASRRSWNVEGARLLTPLGAPPALRELLGGFLLHRYRQLQARGAEFLLPIDIELGEGQFALRYRDEAPLRRAQQGGEPPADWPSFKRHELLPVLSALCACVAEGVTGLAPFAPIAGRLVPPVSFFFPDPGPGPGSDSSAAAQEDLRFLSEWMECQLRALPPSAGPAGDLFLSDLRAALRRPDALRALPSLVAAEEERSRHALPRPSLLEALTEAELLEHVARLLRYELPAAPPRSGEFWLEVAPRFPDPHLGDLLRPSPQELFELLTEESQALPLLWVSATMPDPLRAPPASAPLLEWLAVDETAPRLRVRPPRGQSAPLPQAGYLCSTQAGDLALIARKRRFSSFAGAHPALAAELRAAPRPARTLSRAELDEAVVRARGPFIVQGPPGTGKTYLATQVVRRFLAEQPAARVLICAKEHFALNHLLTTLTRRLHEAALPFRAYRSMSPSRIQRTRAAGEELPPFLPGEVEAEIGGLRFTESARVFGEASSGEGADLRNRSLGRAAATLCFSTTLDALLIEQIDRAGFDLVVVEEAGKCYPSELLHALCLGRCALLIGDHKQLPPYQEAQTRQHLESLRAALGRARKDEPFAESLRARFGPNLAQLQHLPEISSDEESWLRPFEALYHRVPDRFMLNEQFRMERPLSDLVGQVFYGAPFVHRKQEVSPLVGRLPPPLDVPLLWIATPHCSAVPAAAEDPEARRSDYERRVLLGYLRRIPGGPPIDLVLLTPYNAHKELLIADPDIDAECRRLGGRPAQKTVRTTDEYQGREAELTVLSLVRNNGQSRRAFGFLTEPSRLNVMCSRARYRPVIIGCAEHVRRHQSEAQDLHHVLRAFEAAASDPGVARFLDAQEFLHHG